MSTPKPWLDLGLDALPERQADRVRLFRLLFATSTQLRNRLDRELSPSGVTSQQAAMLQMIEAQPQAPTLSVVARALGMTHQNAKQIALVLERKGFIEITIDAADRRARRLQLTAHHHRFWRRRNAADFSSVEAWTAALSDGEIRTVVRLLGKLRANLAAGGS
ncbi:MAG: MarR family transcriptional regulator [Ideonella sp.]|nr:MarR family transcriptional regulator [Ideonella sp.]MCC7458613.1 MarR family transcriptional regulator [Nitrospira sp.]